MKTKILTALFVFSFLLSNNIFSQGWVFQTSGLTTTLRQIVFYNAQTGWTVGDGGKILQSTNGGGTWNLLNSGTTLDLYSIIISDSITLLACGSSGVIIKTTNGGASWTAQTSGTTAKLKYLYNYYQNRFFCCGENGTLKYTSNGGAAWITINSNTTEHLNCIYFEDQTTGWAFGNNGTVRYNAYTAPWIVVSFPTNENLLAVGGGGQFGVTFAFCTNMGNVYKFTGGTSSINTGVSTPLNSIQGIGSGFEFPPKMWCTGDNGVIRYSSDTGHTWTGQNISSSVNITSIFMLDSLRGWIAGGNGTIMGTVTGGVIGIQPISTEIPKGYSLSQNYPNPFNPGTKFKIEIAKSSFTKIAVFDELGRKVAALVNQQLQPGTYEVNWDASNNPSGVYYYRISAGEFTGTKKMVLIK